MLRIIGRARRRALRHRHSARTFTYGMKVDIQSLLLAHLILLVNDIEDAEDMPDYVYFTDATNQEVSMAVVWSH